MNNTKTIICDIDGCISQHTGDICSMHKGNMCILPGVKDTFKEWDINGYNIILMSGRRESVRKDTERQLSDAGIFYDQLVMGMKNGPRVLINDKKVNSIENTAFAVNLERNTGMSGININGDNNEHLTPWGKWEVLLDSEMCKVKRVTINAGHAPSYQYHNKRTETWVIVTGIGELTLNDVKSNVYPSRVIFINKKEKHQLRNTDDDPLVFIETQLGEYFGEDDIIRLKDDYGRIQL